MEDSEPVQFRHLRDILGKYFRQVLGWYGPIEPPVSTVTVQRHQTDDPSIVRYAAMDGQGVAAAITFHVVRK